MKSFTIDSDKKMLAFRPLSSADDFVSSNENIDIHRHKRREKPQVSFLRCFRKLTNESRGMVVSVTDKYLE